MKRILILVLATSSLVFAQPATSPDAPATTAASLPAGPLVIKIASIKGLVQMRATPDEKWAAVAVGQEIKEGAELRTGLKSIVVFTIGDDQTITLDRLGSIQILRANFASGKLFTDLGMKYGRTRFDIEAADREHDAKVRSPSSVLAIRGTDVVLYDQAPFAPEAISLTGRAVFRDAKKQTTVGSKNGKKAKLNSNADTPANYARDNSIVDPRGQFAGRSGNDNLILLSLNATGRSDFQNLGVLSLLGSPTFKGTVIGVLPVDQQLVADFNVTGTAGQTFDFNILTPRGETLSFANPTSTSGGQLIGTNLIAEGGTGAAQLQFPITFPPGTYRFAAANTGTAALTATLGGFTIDPANPEGFRNFDAGSVTLNPGGTDVTSYAIPKAGPIQQTSKVTNPGTPAIPQEGKRKKK